MENSPSFHVYALIFACENYMLQCQIFSASKTHIFFSSNGKQVKLKSTCLINITSHLEAKNQSFVANTIKIARAWLIVNTYVCKHSLHWALSRSTQKYVYILWLTAKLWDSSKSHSLLLFQSHFHPFRLDVIAAAAAEREGGGRRKFSCACKTVRKKHILNI